jgi:hypothetical protein
MPFQKIRLALSKSLSKTENFRERSYLKCIIIFIKTCIFRLNQIEIRESIKSLGKIYISVF